MRKEDAKALDAIMARFTPKCWRTVIENENLYNILSGMGYVTLNCTTERGYDVMLTDEGDRFRATSNFESQLKDKIADMEVKKWNLINAKTATIIAIISLIISTVALLLQFIVKPCF
jgi:hypothetical protein